MGLASLCGDDLSPQAQEILEKLADVVRDHVDMDRVLSIADDLPALPEEPDFWDETAWAGEGAVASSGEGQPCGLLRGSGPRCRGWDVPPADAPRIGYVRDRALWFYYEENLEALRRAGAELVRLSLLDDAAWPELDGLYLGGGFPEDWARELSASPHLARLGTLVARGLPIYAECGGSLSWLRLWSATDSAGHERHLSVETRFCPKPQGLGYVRADVVLPNPYFPQGSVLRGHEFHYSLCTSRRRQRPSGSCPAPAQGHGHGPRCRGPRPGWSGERPGLGLPIVISLPRQCPDGPPVSWSWPVATARNGWEDSIFMRGERDTFLEKGSPSPPSSSPLSLPKLLSGGVAGYGGPADPVLWRVRSTDSGLSGVDEMEKAAFPEYWLREPLPFCCGGTEDAGRER